VDCSLVVNMTIKQKMVAIRNLKGTKNINMVACLP
jgi:hypothetical protein